MLGQTLSSPDLSNGSSDVDHLWSQYTAATRLAVAGDRHRANQQLVALIGQPLDPDLASRIQNDLGVLAVLRGDRAQACEAFEQATTLLPEWETPRANMAALSRTCVAKTDRPTRGMATSCRCRVMIVSLLFNWPSSGGGTVHTAETARFLSRSGYDVRHLVLRYAGWSVGQVAEPVDWPVELLDFDERTWRRPLILERVRAAIERFQPDHVLLTDSWNFKPRLAEAAEGYSYFLRLAAQECLCPLNNVRLLRDGSAGWRSCPQHQLVWPEGCRVCVRQQGVSSGLLHRAERELAGFDEAEYEPSLWRAFAHAAGVLVVNPLIAENVKPFARAVHVIPSGFDPARFPAPTPPHPDPRQKVRLLFAGLIDESMKGFAVLDAACQRLWSQRQDFRLVVTADPAAGRPEREFMDYVGWQSQCELPALMHRCDVVVCPTVAEEALGRTAVEAMGAGRPVIASRIGGLPFTVLEEATGLLCAPGDPNDLARQLARLMDDAALRERLGRCGREIFEQRYTWNAILPRYASLFGEPVCN